jgi:probable F420-dependent oxidoreductase
MLFEVIPPIVANVTGDPDWLAEFATTAERVGLDGIVMPEHVAWVLSETTKMEHDGLKTVTGPTTIFPDPLQALGFLSGITSRLTLATGILLVPQHNPIILAKRLATLDVLSKGRTRIGVGVGWNPDEMALCEQDFATRGKRTDEAIQVMRALWAGSSTDPAGYHGSIYNFDGVFSNPKPVRGDIPVHIGGSSKAAAVRAGRLGNGFQPLNLDAAQLTERMDQARAAAEEAGRDPGAIELTLRAGMQDLDQDKVAEAEASGVTRYVLNGSPTADLTVAVGELQEFADKMGLSANV